MDKYRETLLTKRRELENKMSERDGIAIERSSDALDDVQRSAEREFAISSLDRDWQNIKEIDLALARIADGAYGTCLRCEEEISAKRLNAIPWASLCIRCQEKADLERNYDERFDVVFSDAA